MTKKLISIFTAFSFVITAAAANAHSAPAPVAPSLISAIYGKITGLQDMQSSCAVVNIQDLHSHGETQRNIAEIITTIDKNSALSGIYVEGGIGNIDVSWVKQIQNEPLRNKIADTLLTQGDLTAAEYYAVMNNTEVPLKGIENQALHKENIIRLSNIETKKELYAKIADETTKNIAVLNKIYTTPKNARFNKLLDNYYNGKITDVKLFTVLNKYAQAAKIATDDFPNIKLYILANKTSYKINSSKALKELEDILLLMKQRMTYNAYRLLETQSNHFKDIESLIQAIELFGYKHNLNLTKNFKNINFLIERTNLIRDINPLELVYEQRLLTEKIQTAIAENSAEADIAFISDFKNYFKNYLTASLSKQDWEYVKTRLDKFVYLYEKYTGSYNLYNIKTDFSEINKYYEINAQRDEIFVSNLNLTATPYALPANAARSAEDIIKTAKEVKIIITGGYHSAGLQQLLAKRAVSLIIITPAVTGGLSAAQEKYSATLKKQGKVFSEALAYLIASSNTPAQQNALLIEAAVRLFGLDSAEIAQLKNTLKITDIEIPHENSTPPEELMQKLKTILTTAAVPAINLFNGQTPIEKIRELEYKILKEASLALYDAGVYFEEGAIEEIEKAGFLGKTLDGINYDTYKYFPRVMQLLLLKRSGSTSLTMAFLEKTFNMFNFSIEKRNKWLAAIETPIIILGIYLPFVQDAFIFLHKKSERAYLKEVLTGSGGINDLTRQAFKSAHSNIKIPVIKQIADLAAKLQAGFTANAKHHLFFNNNGFIENAEDAKPNETVLNAEKASTRPVKIIFAIAAALNSAVVLLTLIFTNANILLIPVMFIFSIYPAYFLISNLWALLFKDIRNTITGKIKKNTQNFANIIKEYEITDGSPSVTIQVPVYTEDNATIFNTLKQSLEAIADYKSKANVGANLLVSDDGLQVWLENGLSGDKINELLNKPAGLLSEKEKLALERINFYKENNISFVARPTINRIGKFKKASNLNNTMRLADAIEQGETLENLTSEGGKFYGTYAQGAIVVNDIILLLDKDSGLKPEVISATVGEFALDPKLAYTQHKTIPENSGETYFTEITGYFTNILNSIAMPANALQGQMISFVGHNGFLRKSFLKESGYWDENRISEDYSKAMDAYTLGYHGKFIAYEGLDFTEQVSKTFTEETGKYLRYAYGILEIIFNDIKNIKNGVLTSKMKKYMATQTKNGRFFDVVNIFVYFASYMSLALILPTALLSVFVYNTYGFSMIIPFVSLILTTFQAINSLFANKKTNANPTFNFKSFLFGNIGIPLIFIGYSFSILKGFVRFFTDPFNKKPRSFAATSVDSVDYNNFNAGVKTLISYFKANRVYPLISAILLAEAFILPTLFNITFLNSALFISVVVTPLVLPLLTPQLTIPLINKILSIIGLKKPSKDFKGAQQVEISNGIFAHYEAVNNITNGDAAGIYIDNIPVRISIENNSIIISANGVAVERIIETVNNTNVLKRLIAKAANISPVSYTIGDIEKYNPAQNAETYRSLMSAA